MNRIKTRRAGGIGGSTWIAMGWFCWLFTWQIAAAEPWANLDIGNPSSPGATTSIEGGMNLSGAGADIGGNADQFRFCYQSQIGDFDVQVRVQSLDATDLWAKAGLMVRDSLEAQSAHASVFVTPTLGGCFYQRRSVTGSTASSLGSFPANCPMIWLRLQRTGDVVNAYTSVDARHWFLLGNSTLTTTNEVYLGLALSSHDSNQIARVAFRDWSTVSTNALGPAPLDREKPGPSSRKTGLVISEIMYHPAARADGKNLAFVELFNANPFFEDLSGYRLAGDLDYVFPAGTILSGGGFLVVACDPAALRWVYGITNVLGPYAGSLENSGRVRLCDAAGAVLLEVAYSNQALWPAAADGAGPSLVLARPSYGEADARAWSASGVKGGSPGAWDAFWADALSQVVINELLAHTDDPEVDYVELYNHSGEEVDISGCFLSDDPATGRFAIPAGTVIPAGGFKAFTQTQLGFALKTGGETVFFTSPDKIRVLDAVRCEAQAVGVSLGRVPDGAAEFYPLAAKTPGAPNGRMLVHDVVINEIMYHPLSDTDDDEYVELFNRGSNSVSLAGWRFVSGIDFTFPASAMLPPGGFLVVARDPERLRTNYTQLDPAKVVGAFQGRLAKGGERLALARPEPIADASTQKTNQAWVVVDEVTYAAGGRWGRWSGGGGSSLELIDPASNHRLAANWADSDETGKAEWTTVEWTGVLDNGSGAADSLDVLLLGAGECLLDNVVVTMAGATNNLIANGTFESGTNGWLCLGDHVRTGWETNGGFNSSRCLHLRASNQGDTGANRLRVLLTGSTLRANQQATIRAQVRWLSGFPEIVLRLHGNYLEAFGRLSAPSNPGTPGAPNSRAKSHAAPVIYDVSHFPTLPPANQPASVTAKLDDVRGTAALTLKYRADTATSYVSVLMVDDGTGGDAVAGDGIFTAFIPQQTAGRLIAFHLQAEATNGTAGVIRYPSDAPARECLVRFGESVPASSFGTYRLWLTTATVNTWRNRPVMSNEELDGTFVYDNQRVIYNMGGRFSGSPWHQGSFDSPVGKLCTYALSFPADDQLLGTTSFNKLHAPGNTAGDDSTIQCEQTAYWMVRQIGLPWNYQRYVNVYVNGWRRGTLMEDTQVPGGDVIEEHFPDDAQGDLFKLNGWYEYDATTVGSMNFSLISWCTLNNYTTTGGVKKTARYRWNWSPRAVRGTANDFTNLWTLTDAANAPADSTYGDNLEAVADMRQWLRTFAIEHAVGNWDSFGNRNAQNMYAYKPERDVWKLLIWDFNIVLGNSGSDGPTGDNLFQFYTADRGMGKIYNFSKYTRWYLEMLGDIARGPMSSNQVNAIMDAKYAAFKANNVNVTAPSSVKTWIASRRSFLLSYLTNFNVGFAITNRPGADFSTDRNWITLGGLAPLGVETMQINGREYPVTWDGLLNWSVRVPLHDRENSLTIQGFDGQGRLMSNIADTITIGFNGISDNPAESLVINEIMYHPTIPGAEYIELYNRSTNSAFDLSGYRLSGVDFTFADGTLLEPGKYLLVVKDRVAVVSAYGNSLPIAGQYNGRLNPEGETLELIQPVVIGQPETIIDAVTFGASAPWPEAANGGGASLQLLSPELDNGRVANWGAVERESLLHPAWRFVSVTGRATNAPLLVYHSPFQPSPDPRDLTGTWNGTIDIPGQPYEMSTIFRRAGTNAWAGDFFGGGGTVPLANIKFTSSSLSFDFGSNGSSSGNPRWSGRLSADGQTISGTFSQESGGSTVSFPFTLRREVDSAVALGGEVYLDDLQLVAGEVSGAGTNLIHNGDFEAPLDGSWTVSSNHQGSALSTVIKRSGNASLHLVADRGGQGQTTAMWQNPEPLIEGATYTLSYWYLPGTNGNELTVRLTDNSLASTQNIRPDTLATPGRANRVAASIPALPNLYINEIQPINRNGAVDRFGHRVPWVELFNAGTNRIELAGYYLANNAINLAQWSFPSNAVIEPGQYRLIWLEGQSSETADAEWYAGFVVPATNGIVLLSHDDGRQSVVIDYLSYSTVGADYSYGTGFGGQGSDRQILTVPTPGKANDAQLPLPTVLITEWMAANTRLLADPADGHFEDWFELFNPSTNEVDLTGYTLTDDLTNPGKWTVPAGTRIGPGGYLLVWADEDTSQNGFNRDLHTNFKLSQTGESIGIFTPGGARVDTVVFGPQVENVSQGRWPQTAGPEYQFMTQPTPGAANVAPIHPGIFHITNWSAPVNGVMTLAWEPQPGLVYQVQYNDSLSVAGWRDYGRPLTAASAIIAVASEPASGSGQRFYRVVVK